MPAELPGGLTPMMRFIFNLPPWVQITAVCIAALLAVAAVWFVWRRRARITGWIRTRSRGWKIALVAGGVLVVAGAGAGGVAGWNYSMHDNSFCVSCHLMTPAFQRFEVSQHRNLECHACHRQSIFTSLTQLYYWVADRPDEVPPHAKVPTRICSECHMSEPGALELHGGPNAATPVKLDRAPDDTLWKHVLNTSGHAVHMRNDDPKFDKIACVTCHGAEVHRFQPVDKTCGQARCHDDVHIQLGKMAGQTALHCTGCHEFKSGITTANISPDSARTGLVPKSNQCFSCHQMKEKLADYELAADKHQGSCGMCHDPHKQKTPAEAFTSCQNGGCHQRIDTLTAFHRGLGRDALANCASCHKAHTWKVQSTDCKACHVNPDLPLPDRGLHARFRVVTAGAATVPSSVAPGVTSTSAETPARRRGGPSVDEGWNEAPDDTVWETTVAPLKGAASLTQPGDSNLFSHRKHKDLACTSCHATERSHGQLLVRGPNDCAACHHATTQKAQCRECHDDRELGKQLVLSVPVKTTVTANIATRPLGFKHEQHAKTECKACHDKSPTLAFDRGCASCHADHHVAERDCKTCHASAASAKQHTRERAHQGCGGSGCHEDAAVAALPAVRNVCLACHAKEVDHKPGRDCGSCHLVGWTAASRGGMQ